MRVTNNSNQPVQSGEAAAARKTDKAQESSSAKKAASNPVAVEGSARTDISAKAREFAKAQEVAASTPDVREEKIAELKRRIQSGSYSVDPNAIADRMVSDHLKTGGA